MTKKDYIMLAAALKLQKPEYTPHDDSEDHGAIAYHQWSHDVVAVASACKADNPKFQFSKFATACGIPNLILD